MTALNMPDDKPLTAEECKEQAALKEKETK